MDRAQTESFIKSNFGGIAQDYPWEDSPDFCVFRHADNRKWFALLFSAKYSTLIRQTHRLAHDHPPATASPDSSASIINLKSDPDLIETLLAEPGILPAYHMNKRHWITVLLDGSCPPDRLKSLIALSYDLTMKRR